MKRVLFNNLWRSDLILLPLILAVAGCGGSGSAPPPVVEPPPDPVGGLDQRPGNATCVAPARESAGLDIAVERVFAALNFAQPLHMLQAPNDASRWFVLEKGGRVRVFDNEPGIAAAGVFLDLSGVVNTASEGGLLGLAFAPDFAATGTTYLSYTRTRPGDSGMQSVISRFGSADGGLTLDPGSEQVLLTIDQPFNNHNGGGIKFGPDGHLYIGLGDGGSGGDPQNNAQNTANLHGTFLRIDVSGPGDYVIPPDNPFAGNPRCDNGEGTEACPEIYAWGLRNPWRFSFDRDTGRLWAGDVGQSAREEINLIEPGGNYGWRIREGFACFDPPTDCPSAGLTDPVLDYPHTEGRSVTGGYVYRGEALQTLHGRYVFGDFVSGRIWVLESDGDGGYDKVEIASTGLSIASFGEGADAELYVVDFGGGLYQLQASEADAPGAVPELLSETGCVDPADPATPATGLIPYQPQSPMWADGATQERWMALPDGSSITLADDGGFGFPPGAVLMRHLRREGVLLETRLLMRHADGHWGGYTYAWNEAGTDAVRVAGGAIANVAGRPWLYPAETECLQCHTAAAGRTLGLELAQLNAGLRYPSTGRTANQLATLDAIGLLSPPLPGDPPDVADLAALPDPAGEAPLADRARSYLHANCASCHRPGGPTPAELDLRFSVPLDEAGMCDEPPVTSALPGVDDALLLHPGDPDRSLVWLRMGRRDVHAMPPVGTLEADEAGLDLVGGWIASLESCF